MPYGHRNTNSARHQTSWIQLSGRVAEVVCEPVFHVILGSDLLGGEGCLLHHYLGATPPLLMPGVVSPLLGGSC